MCGLVGILASGADPKPSRPLLSRMADTLAHRGPDDSGVWMDPSGSFGMGHRRLSIIDLSAEGRQPMVSASGRYVIAYNGEIYNFGELRKELERGGAGFRGHSDTEVILAAVEAWGLERAVRRFVGMFAFGLWDVQQRRLHLVRDRLGIKPLYYGHVDGNLVFASELKAIRTHPRFRGEIDRSALTLLLRYGYVPAPYAIYDGIRKVLPGCILSFTDCDGVEPSASMFWSAREVAERGTREPLPGSDSEAVSALEALLLDAVGARMVADVPLGAFLSGGIDSSTVVALMQAQSSRPVKTFSIGFHEAGYDEAKHAKSVAAHLGTEHTELYVTPAEAQAVIPKLPELYDEPFSDVSQIPTYLVSELARRHVTVALSGDGGDELFGGYHRYTWGQRMWRSVGWMPSTARARLAAALTRLPSGAWTRIYANTSGILPEKLRINRFGDRVHKLADILTFADAARLYRELVSHWKVPSEIVRGASEPGSVYTEPHNLPELGGFLPRMMFMDLMGYLPDDILTKVDRASMGVSLEARVPVLDHRVVELAWRLPLHMKVRRGQSKWILRQLLYKHVPKNLLERPKMGFGVPIDAWLRGPLREWAETLLDHRRLQQEGFFESDPIRHKWEDHLSGKRNWDRYLWDVLMFQSWLEAQQTRERSFRRVCG